MAVTQAELRAILSIRAEGVQVLSQVEAALGRLGATSRTTGSSFGQLAGGFAVGTIAANAIIGALSAVAGAATGAAGGIINLSSNLEQARIGFTTMLGSAQKADQFIGQLQSKAESTAFNFPGIQQVAQSFLAMGIDGKNVIPIIDDISNALSAAGHGGDTDRLQRVGQSLSEIAAAGKISGEQIRELSRNGIAVLPLLAEAFGKTTAEVRKMAEANEISSTMFFEAFHSQVALHYGDIQAQQAKTWAVAATNVQDILGRLSTETFAELTQALTAGALAVNDFLHSEGFAQWAADVKASIHEVMAALAPLGVAIREAMGLPGQVAAAAAAPAGRPAPPVSRQARDDWRVPPEAITSAAEYDAKIKEATATVHGLTEQLTAVGAAQEGFKTQIEDIKTRYGAMQDALKAKQDGINAQIEATKTKWEGVLEPLQRTESQLQRLAEDTKASFATILDPLKTQLDGVNRQISDSKLAFEATVTPIQRQIDAITKANTALQKQRDLVLRIADLNLRESQLKALGDPGRRGEIAAQLQGLQFSQDDLERQKEILDLGNKKGNNDKAIAGVQKQLDANRLQQIKLEQQAADLINRKLSERNTIQGTLNDAAQTEAEIAKGRADIETAKQVDPLQAKIDAAKAGLQTVLDPLELQAAALSRMLEDVGAKEAAALKPITDALTGTTRQIQDANEALKSELKPLEDAAKAVAGELAANAAAQAAELAPLEAKSRELDRHSNALDLQKRQLADQINQWKDEKEKIKEVATEAGKLAAKLDLSGGEAQVPGQKVGGGDQNVPKAPAKSLIPPEIVGQFNNAAVAIAGFRKGLDDFGASIDAFKGKIAPMLDEWNKLSARFGGGGTGSESGMFSDTTKLAAFQRFGDGVINVITGILRGLNNFFDALAVFGQALDKQIQAWDLLLKGDPFGAMAAQKDANALLETIPGILSRGFGAAVAGTETALAPLGPTVQEAIDNGIIILPQLPAAVRGQVIPLQTAAMELGAVLDTPVAAGIQTTIDDANKALPGIPQAVADQHAEMYSQSSLLGDAMHGGLNDGINTGKPATEKNIGDWINDIITKVKGWLGISSPSTVFLAIGTDMTQGLTNGVKTGWDTLTGWFKPAIDGVVAFLDPLAAVLKSIAGAIASMPANIPGWLGGLIGMIRGGGGGGGAMQTAYRPGQGGGFMGDAGPITPEAARIMTGQGGFEPDTSSPSAFLTSFTPQARAAAVAAGLEAWAGDIAAAIASNETGYGKAVAGQNYFGIKGSNPMTGANTGPVNTWEDYGSGPVNIQDTFRAYDNPLQSVADFFQFLKDNSRYQDTLQQQDPTSFITALKAAGYATDPAYVSKILSIYGQAQAVPNASGGEPSMQQTSFTPSQQWSPDAINATTGATKELTQAQTVGAQVASAQANAQGGLNRIMTAAAPAQAAANAAIAGAAAPTAALATAQQNAFTWAREMARQQAALTQVMDGQAPAGRAATDAMAAFSDVLGPIERQVAGGAISADTLRFKLIDLARATSLDLKPFEALSSGLMDSSEAMEGLINDTAGLSPAFKAVQAYMATAGSTTNQAALQWLQAALNYNKAKDEVAVAAATTPTVPAGPVASVTALGTTWDTTKASTDLATTAVTTYQTAVSALDPKMITEMAGAWTSATGEVAKFSDAAHQIGDYLDKHEFHFKATFDDVPDDYKPGSPSPLEHALRGIIRAGTALNRLRVRPNLSAAVLARGQAGLTGRRVAVPPMTALVRDPIARIRVQPGRGAALPPITVHIAGSVVSENDLSMVVRDVLIKHGRRNGGRILE